jgi:hypothetical protein
MSAHAKPKPRPVITYPRDAILETADVCVALRVSQEIVDKMDLPCFYAGKRPRYLWGMVLDALAERARPTKPVLSMKQHERPAMMRP